MFYRLARDRPFLGLRYCVARIALSHPTDLCFSGTVTVKAHHSSPISSLLDHITASRPRSIRDRSYLLVLNKRRHSPIQPVPLCRRFEPRGGAIRTIWPPNKQQGRVRAISVRSAETSSRFRVNAAIPPSKHLDPTAFAIKWSPRRWSLRSVSYRSPRQGRFVRSLPPSEVASDSIVRRQTDVICHRNSNIAGWPRFTNNAFKFVAFDVLRERKAVGYDVCSRPDRASKCSAPETSSLKFSFITKNGGPGPPAGSRSSRVYLTNLNSG